VPFCTMLKIVSKTLGSGTSLIVLSVVLLASFGALFYADDAVKKSQQTLGKLTIDAERILAADLNSTTAVRLSASLQSERYVLNYQDYQDTKYALLDEVSKFQVSDKVREYFKRMEDVQADIEDAESEAISFIDEEKWEDALELVTEPAFRRQKGIYRASLSSALREMILSSEQQADQAATLSQTMQFGVLVMFLMLALIGVLYTREMKDALRRQRELALSLEDSNENLEQRVTERTVELQENQALFKTVLDNMPAAVFLKSAEGAFQLVNKRYEDIYDVTLDHVRGKTLYDLYPKVQADIFTAIDAKAKMQSGLTETEHTQKMDGNPIVLSSVMFPIEDRHGEISGYGGIEIDITERKKAEERLAEKEGQLRAALDNMSDGIFVLDADLNYVLYNDRYLEMIELPAGSVGIGKPMRDAVTAHARRGDYGPGDIEELVDLRITNLGNDQPVESEMFMPELARYNFINKMPMNAGGCVVVISDVTARKTAEQELAREKAVLDVTLEAMDQGISMIDDSLNMLAFNAKFLDLLEFPADRFPPGTSMETLLRYNADRGEYGDEDIDEAIQLRMELARKFEAHQFERTRPDGTVIEVRGNPLADKTGFVTTYTDITARKEAEEQLQQAYKLISGSINYASRIQRSILPGDDYLSAILSDHFILWEPRDIVGGDIYWAGMWGDGFLIMLGDCTGHGVPGAFMTLISTSALERSLQDVEVGNVGGLVARMHQYIQLTLRQNIDTGESDDGIELGVCYLPEDQTSMAYAGARFELMVVDGEDVSIIKGDKKGAGYRAVPYVQEFETKTLQVRDGQRFYLTTDGLIDQIGGTRRRSFGKRRLKSLLLSIQELPFDEQRERIYEAFTEFQGDQVRRDDVAVIGFEISSV